MSSEKKSPSELAKREMSNIRVYTSPKMVKVRLVLLYFILSHDSV